MKEAIDARNSRKVREIRKAMSELEFSIKHRRRQILKGDSLGAGYYADEITKSRKQWDKLNKKLWREYRRF